MTLLADHDQSAPEHGFSSVEEAVSHFRQNKFVIILDSTSRENEGDLVIAAAGITPEQMAFLIHHSSGYVCAPITKARAAQLDLPLMVPVEQASDPNRTAYTISVDAAPLVAGVADSDSTDAADADSAVGLKVASPHDSFDVDAARREVTTGISARDRATVCRLLADPVRAPDGSAFRKPGHILPLLAVDGGVRFRPGHTEAAIDMCRLAGLTEAGVICEIVDPGVELAGSAARTGIDMLRRDGCLELGRRYGIPVITIEAMIEHLNQA